jgi:hypothetical protein
MPFHKLFNPALTSSKLWRWVFSLNYISSFSSYIGLGYIKSFFNYLLYPFYNFLLHTWILRFSTKIASQSMSRAFFLAFYPWFLLSCFTNFTILNTFLWYVLFFVWVNINWGCIWAKMLFFQCRPINLCLARPSVIILRRNSLVVSQKDISDDWIQVICFVLC